MKKIIVNLLLLLFGIMVATLMAEGVVRVFKLSFLWDGVRRGYYNDDMARFHIQDRTFRYLPKPNLDVILQKWQGEFKMRWQTNSKGFRSGEVPYRRTDKKKRVLFLGDSFGWGFGVSNPELFSYILQSRYDDILEIVNLSVTGYGLPQEYLMYRTEGVKYAPDVVIQLFCMTNDIYPYTKSTDDDIKNTNGPYFVLKNNNAYFQPKKYSLVSKEEFDQLGRRRGFLNGVRFIIQTHSALSNLLFERLSRFHQLIPFLRKVGGTTFIVEELMPTIREKDAFMTAKVLKKFKSEAKDNGSDFIVVVIPDIYHVDAAIKKGTIDYTDKTFKPIFWLTKQLESEGIQHINLLEEFTSAKWKDKRMYYIIDRHLNPEGHKALAEIIANFLFEHQFKDMSTLFRREAP